MTCEISGSNKVETYYIQRKYVGCLHRDVEIKFVDDVFDSCSFIASNPYSRDEWKMLSQIEALISKIEEEKREKGKSKSRRRS